jgi:hypothetical protein
MNFEEANSLRLACLGHAKELLDEAEKLLQTSPHLSFHLATWAAAGFKDTELGV